MFGDTITITFIIFAGAGVVAGLVMFKIIAGWQRKRQRDARLDSAFDRARHQQQSGRGASHL